MKKKKRKCRKVSRSVASQKATVQTLLLSTYNRFPKIYNTLTLGGVWLRHAPITDQKSPSLYKGETPVHHPPHKSTGVSPHYTERVLANYAQMGGVD